MRHLLSALLLLVSACTISYSGYEPEEETETVPAPPVTARVLDAGSE